MYNSNLFIAGYDFGYNSNTYYVDRKDDLIAWPSDLRIAKAINLMVSDNDLGDYEVDDVVVTTNIVENNQVVTQNYTLKRVKLFVNYKCTKTTSVGTKIVKYVRPKVFYPACSKVNVLCSSTRGGVVAASVVCRQSL